MCKGIKMGAVFKSQQEVLAQLPDRHAVVIISQESKLHAYNESMDPKEPGKDEILKKNLAGAKHFFDPKAMIISK